MTSGKEENTLVHLAVQQKWEKVVGLLLENSSMELKEYYIKTLNKDGLNAFHRAVLKKNIDLVKYLEEEHPSSVNCRTKEQETGLHLAAKLGDAKMIKCLVDLGADLDLKDKDGHTPLHDCLQRVQLEGGATEEGVEKCAKFITVWKAIQEVVLIWWCKRKDIEVPYEYSDEYQKCT